MSLLAFKAWARLLAREEGVPEARKFVLLLKLLLENVQVFNYRPVRVSALKLPLKRNRLLLGGELFAQGVHLPILQWLSMERLLGVAPL
jgi:hypothetical protein